MGKPEARAGGPRRTRTEEWMGKRNKSPWTHGGSFADCRRMTEGDMRR